MKLDVPTLQYVATFLEKEGFPRAAIVIGQHAQIVAASDRAAAAISPMQAVPPAAKAPSAVRIA